MLKLVAYAANTGRTPDHISIPDDERWFMTDYPGQPAGASTGSATAVIEGCLLHIIDDDTTARHVYARYDPLNSTDNAVFEISCRPLSTGNSYGVFFGFIDTKKYMEVGLFGAGSVYVVDSGQSATFTTNDKLHTYRIVKTGEVKLELFADGKLLLDIPYDKLGTRPSEFPGSQRQVIATSTPEEAEWEIAYVSYCIAS